MGLQEKQYNTFFELPPDIWKNIYDTSWKSFFASKRKKTEFEKSDKGIGEYVSELVRNNVITRKELKDFLFNELSFGMHRDVLLYKFKEELLFDDTRLLGILGAYGVNNLKYNDLDKLVFKKGSLSTEQLAAVDIIKNDSGYIEVVKLIYVKQVRYTKKEEKIDYGNKVILDVPYYENSYFPVEINFKKKELIVKSAPKTRINKAEYKGIKISDNLVSRVKNSFGLTLITHQCEYQKILHGMCKKLLEDVIKDNCRNELLSFKELNSNIVTEIREMFSNLGIDIDELSKKIKTKNVFDIENQLSNMIENIVISKNLVDIMESNQLDVGIISYIKFKDKTLVNTVLKTDRRKDTLLDTQAYLDLRKTIQQSRLAERIRVVWFNDEEELQLAYDARNLLYIHLHFYERLFEGDLRYGIDRINCFKN